MKLHIGIILGYVLVLYLAEAAAHIGAYPDKMWLHRCNSLEKLYAKQEMYPNVEVDVVFRHGNTFDVTHDAERSNGLTLEPYFALIAKTEGKLWLDIKNLATSNLKALGLELKRLREEYHVGKEQLIIESPCWQALAPLTRRGYYTSCYVPYDKPSELTDEEIDDCLDELRHIADSRSVCALSFPGWWYHTLKEELDRPIDFLTWKHRTTQFEFFITPPYLGRDLLKDKQLKVILIKDKGGYDDTRF